ncbi:hypothetical protein QQ045_025300 [Rhodiola kirilowii]
MDAHIWPNPRESLCLYDTWWSIEAGTLAISVDGSWDVDSRLAGMGIVAKDYEGVVEWTSTFWSSCCSCASEAELAGGSYGVDECESFLKSLAYQKG